jgi:hypothetical protein
MFMFATHARTHAPTDTQAAYTITHHYNRYGIDGRDENAVCLVEFGPTRNTPPGVIHLHAGRRAAALFSAIRGRAEGLPDDDDGYVSPTRV